MSVYRFPEQLRQEPKIFERESQIISPQRVCGIYIIRHINFSHVRVGQLVHRKKIKAQMEQWLVLKPQGFVVILIHQ